MSNRKLQVEIDRVIKKVDEGVIVFEQIWEKIYSANSGAQKEKYEADLKKEIKKLQRLRDQIKTWQGDSAIKDKSKIDQYRKIIEEKMEKFKICEKETKTKAFSKEGLARDRIDPKEKAKRDVGDWVGDCISRLSDQLEEFEAELEALTAAGKKGKKSSSKDQETQRIADVTEHIERHTFHIEMLEKMLRAVDNEGIEPDDANDLRDSVEYYVESNQDPDFYEDTELYSALDLDSVPVAAAALITRKIGVDDHEEEEEDEGNDTADDNDSKAGKAEDKKDKKKDKALSKPAPAAIKDTTKPIKAPTVKAPAAVPPAVTKPAPPAKVTANPTSSIQVPQTSVPAIAPTSAPATTVAPAAVFNPANKAPLLSSIVKGSTATESTSNNTDGSTQNVLSFSQFSTQGLQPPAPKPVEPAAGANYAALLKKGTSAATASAPIPVAQESKNVAPVVEKPAVLPATSPVMEPASSTLSAVQEKPAPTLSPETRAQATQAQKESSPFTKPESSAVAQPSKQSTEAMKTPDPPQTLPSQASPQPQASSTESSTRATIPEEDLSNELDALNGALGFMPESCDSENTSRFQTIQNQIPVPPSFPTSPPKGFDTPQMFEKFDVDTLFFIFYYQQGQYQQYLAARQLKLQSWRFHKKYLTWFQRHDEPKVMADDHEQGTYLYFDYVLKDELETGWCQRVKSEFTFEYKYLEDELNVQ